MSGVFLGNVRSINVITAVIDPASVAANTTAEQTFTVPGILPGDYVDVVKPSLNAGLAVGTARVPAANQIAIQFINDTGSPIDAPSETWQIFVARPEAGNNNSIQS